MIDMPGDDTTRWTVTVSKETDLALRAFLGNRGMRKGDISKFIEEAVRWRMFHQSRNTVREAFADLSGDQVQALVDEALTEVRNEARARLPPTPPTSA
jgi:hypothetical protein